MSHHLHSMGKLKDGRRHDYVQFHLFGQVDERSSERQTISELALYRWIMNLH
jgi:hypothetical protein